MKIRNMLVLTCVALIVGCNDSNELGSETSNITAKNTYSITAIDGYLQDANVWLDMNDNSKWDEGEPYAISGKGGIGNINVEGIDNPEQYPVIVEVIAGLTLDEDTITDENPQGVVSMQGYVMSAPAGETAVTPLSTLVHIIMKTAPSEIPEEEKKQVALAFIAEKLGIEADDILGDFILTDKKELAFVAQTLVKENIMPASTEDLITAFSEPDESIIFDNLEEIEEIVSNKVEEIKNNPNASLDDIDSDGVDDINDAFPFDEWEWVDTDADGTGDNADPFDNDPTEWVDTDLDGVGDNSDVSPFDHSVINYTLQLRAHDPVLNVVGIADDASEPVAIKGQYTSQTNGDSVWIYSPIFASHSLDEYPDVSYLAASDAQIFMNIYLLPNPDNANTVIGEFVTAEIYDNRHFKQLSYGPDGVNYLKVTLYNGEHLNDILAEQHLSKSNYLVASYYDAPSEYDGDYEAKGNFFIRFGDSNYSSMDEFTLHDFNLEPSFKLDDDGVSFVSSATQAPGTIEINDMDQVELNTNGDALWVYRKLDKVSQSLQDVGNFTYQAEIVDGDNVNIFANIYVHPTDDAIDDGILERFENNTSHPIRNTKWGDNTFVISLKSGETLSDVLQANNVDASDFTISNFHDSATDGDPEAYGNFFVRLGGSTFEGDSKVILNTYEFND